MHIISSASACVLWEFMSSSTIDQSYVKAWCDEPVNCCVGRSHTLIYSYGKTLLVHYSEVILFIWVFGSNRTSFLASAHAVLYISFISLHKLYCCNVILFLYRIITLKVSQCPSGFINTQQWARDQWLCWVKPHTAWKESLKLYS